MTGGRKDTLDRSFILGKLFSLLGIVPLGIYVISHLYNNTRSVTGPETFNAYLTQSRETPILIPLMVMIIWVPIFFHGIYGLLVVKRSKPNLVRFPFFENVKWALQRLSGLGLLFFIPAHIYKTRIEPTMHGQALDFNHMVEALHEPLTFAVYLLGVLGVSYHLANGIWQFAIGWGLALSERGMRRMQILSMIVFVSLAVLGYTAIWGFYRA